MTDNDTVEITTTLEIPKEVWENVSEIIEEHDNSRRYSKKYKAEKAFELLDFLYGDWMKDTMQECSVLEAERRIQNIKEVFRQDATE